MSRDPTPTQRLTRGDIVEVRSVCEILSTLDENGTLDDLPFMPEMLAHCGKSYRVHRRVEQFTFDGAAACRGESAVREFRKNDVVLLESLRCSGVDHAGCNRACMIFWKEAWLQRMPPVPSTEVVTSIADTSLSPTLRTSNGDGTYFCQSSQLFKATLHLSGKQRIAKCLRNTLTRNYGVGEMIRHLLVWSRERTLTRIRGIRPVGTAKKTPQESLDLKPGEWVRVKSLDAIIETLDSRGCNRGLHFSSDMIPYCGRILQVRNRVEQIIVEGIGTIRKLKNTVYLTGAVCDSATWAFGACPRDDHLYWREIWLERTSESTCSHRPIRET